MRSLLSFSGAIAARHVRIRRSSHQKFNKKSSLSWLLILPFVLQTTVAVGLTGYLAFWNGQQAVHSVVTQLHTETTQRIQDHLDNHLENASLINQINASAIRLNQLDVNNWEALQHYFAVQLKQFKAITSISFGNEKGEVLGVRRLPNDQLTIGISRQTLGHNTFYRYLATQDGEQERLLETIPNFVLQERPWYQAALHQDHLVWAPIYQWLGNNSEMGITAAQTVEDASRKQVGVLSVSLSLASIDQFLQNTQAGRSGQTFILERSGKVVASSIAQQQLQDPVSQIEPQKSQHQSQQHVQAIESNIPLIQATSRYLVQRFEGMNHISSSQQLAVELEGTHYYVQVTPFSKGHGLDWLIVVVVPESAFMEQINNNTRTTLVLCLITLAVALALGIGVSRRIAQPIRHLSEASQKIAHGNLDQRVDQHISVTELATLARSFNQMCQELQQSRQQLEDYSRSLERNVAERTQELEAEIHRRSVIENVLQNANQELQRMAFLDGLTQVANRRYLDETLSQEWWRARRSQLPLSVILCDVDFFKQYNDSYGHQAGDDCLRRIAKALRSMIRRPADLVARYGGEEFILVLPDTQIEGAIQIAQEIQAEIKRLQMPHIGSKIGSYVTLSLGVASVVPKVGASPSQLIGAADRSLYQAKAQGRNCIVAYEIDREGNKKRYELENVHIA